MRKLVGNQTIQFSLLAGQKQPAIGVRAEAFAIFGEDTSLVSSRGSTVSETSWTSGWFVGELLDLRHLPVHDGTRQRATGEQKISPPRNLPSKFRPRDRAAGAVRQGKIDQLTGMIRRDDERLGIIQWRFRRVLMAVDREHQRTRNRLRKPNDIRRLRHRKTGVRHPVAWLDRLSGHIIYFFNLASASASFFMYLSGSLSKSAFSDLSQTLISWLL